MRLVNIRKANSALKIRTVSAQKKGGFCDGHTGVNYGELWLQRGSGKVWVMVILRICN